MSDKKQFQALQAPKGVPDYVPPQSATFDAVRKTLVGQAYLAGYSHIELPVFEDTTVFARGVGESTDVVSKEMQTAVSATSLCGLKAPLVSCVLLSSTT